jgi:CO dehydrogenase maturation factor
MCSSHATVRGILHELPENDSMVIVDAEASPEHLSRATVEAVDLQLVIAEPYFKSLETARRYSRLGRDLGIPTVAVVANKIRNEDDQDAIGEFCHAHDMELFSVVPFDDAAERAERRGVAPLDYDPSAPMLRELQRMCDRVLSSPAGR